MDPKLQASALAQSIDHSTFSDTDDEVDILDYVQLVMLGGMRVALEVRSRNGDRGRMFIEEGEVRHAICGDLEGEEALYACLGFTGGSFVNLPWTEPEKVTVHTPARSLLMEASRKRDMKRRGCESAVISKESVYEEETRGDPKLAILVIDSLQPVVSIIKDGLTGYGHKVLTALSGSHGLEIFDTHRVDVVISELGISDMSGWQVGKEITTRCRERGWNRPAVILLTGWLEPSPEEENIEEHGVSLIARKPIDISKLENTIWEVVHEAKAKKRNCTEQAESRE